MVEKLRSNWKRMLKWVGIALIYAVPIFVAQSALFIKFDGVDGEANDKDHKGWSDLLSFSHGMSRPSSGAAGTARGRGAVVMEDITVAKLLDKASPKLAEALCRGKVFPKVEIHVTSTYADGGRLTYLIYELKNVLVSSLRPASAGNSEQRPTEELKLNFEQVKQTYVEYDSKGLKKGNVEFSWKVEEGTK